MSKLYTEPKSIYTTNCIQYIGDKKMEIICIGTETFEDADYMTCHHCGTPIHYDDEVTGHGTHELGCPFCGGFLGCDD